RRRPPTHLRRDLAPQVLGHLLAVDDHRCSASRKLKYATQTLCITVCFVISTVLTCPCQPSFVSFQPKGEIYQKRPLLDFSSLALLEMTGCKEEIFKKRPPGALQGRMAGLSL
ncbi:MAG TPA: hypothetical protein PK983_11560, partial [Syntrophales bacterium]|nr:hypothetical protein [Syntrophales bacterium]